MLFSTYNIYYTWRLNIYITSNVSDYLSLVVYLTIKARFGLDIKMQSQSQTPNLE